MTITKNTDGSMALAERRQQVITIEATAPQRDICLRVAAYARVSSASEDQLNSFDAQRRYYTALISGNENWQLVDIYADEGITGTSAQKRPDFQRLLADCRRGRIDRVLVKSISRFARNTPECLEALRELKQLGVSVYFEKENIDTVAMSGEMMTAVFAAMAQAESKSISDNLRWGVRKRMQNGTFLPASQPYGYRIKDRRICIDPAQASVVQRIFADYLSGVGIEKIAGYLNQQESTNSLTGRKNWTTVSIARILKNEKYTGDSRWQKTYMTEEFPPQKRINRGEKDQYFMPETHPAIIGREMFEQVQTLLKRRTQRGSTTDEALQSPFRQKVRCGCCGASMRRKYDNRQAYRVCRAHAKSKAACPMLPVPEEQLEEAFLRLYYNLRHHDEMILGRFVQRYAAMEERRMIWRMDIRDLNRKISDLSGQLQMLASMRQQGLIDPDIYIAQSNAVSVQLRTAKAEREQLCVTDDDTTLQDTQYLLDILEDGPDILEAFDTDIFNNLVEKIIVESCEKIRFRLKNGLELEETIERTVR